MNKKWKNEERLILRSVTYSLTREFSLIKIEDNNSEENSFFKQQLRFKTKKI